MTKEIDTHLSISHGQHFSGFEFRVFTSQRSVAHQASRAQSILLFTHIHTHTHTHTHTDIYRWVHIWTWSSHVDSTVSLSLSLSLSVHQFQSFIIHSRFSWLHSVSTQWLYIHVVGGRPTLARRCIGVFKRTSPNSQTAPSIPSSSYLDGEWNGRLVTVKLHTNIYIYIYIYIFVCVCVYI